MHSRDAHQLLSLWQKELNLSDWDVDLRWGKVSEKDIADCQVDLGEKSILITLSVNRKKEVTEGVLVHELVHALVFRLWQYVEIVLGRGFKDTLSRKTLEAEYEAVEEEVVDRLTSVLLRRKSSQKSRPRRSSPR